MAGGDVIPRHFLHDIDAGDAVIRLRLSRSLIRRFFVIYGRRHRWRRRRRRSGRKFVCGCWRCFFGIDAARDARDADSEFEWNAAKI